MTHSATYSILIVLTPAFDPDAGGVQRSTHKMSGYFKEHGHNTHVFSYQQSGHQSQDVAKLHHANQENAHKNPVNNDQLQKLIRQLKSDIVINQMPYEHDISKALVGEKENLNYLLLGCLRNTLYSVKLNLDSYLSKVLPKPLQPFFKNNIGRQVLLQKHKQRHTADLKKILDYYDYFVMFGPPNLKELRYFVGDYKLNKTHFIPNSILSVLPKLPAKEKRILWLSRLSYGQKRADLILPFWKKVMHELPDWELDIVGDGNAYDNLIKQKASEKIPRVNLYGKQVPDKYYQRSPIYIMTSENEGFPNTLIEAQSFGAIPVVFDNYPICSWVVKNGNNGVLIPPFKVDQMAEEVINLAKNEERREKLMQAALDNARKFHIDHVGKQWVEFFNRKLNKSKPA